MEATLQLPEESHQNLKIFKNLNILLSQLETQSTSYKNHHQRKLINSNHDLFRKKSFDECLKLIRTRLSDWVFQFF